MDKTGVSFPRSVTELHPPLQGEGRRRSRRGGVAPPPPPGPLRGPTSPLQGEVKKGRKDHHMPLTRVSLRRGRSAADRKAILDGIYLAMRETFNVPEDDR